MAAFGFMHCMVGLVGMLTGMQIMKSFFPNCALCVFTADLRSIHDYIFKSVDGFAMYVFLLFFSPINRHFPSNDLCLFRKTRATTGYLE
jgi:hypothetical protein